MRILIDAQCLVQNRTGVGWAAKYMIESLSKADQYNKYTLLYFGGKNVVTDLSDLKLGKNFKIKKFPIISRRVIDALFKKGLLPKGSIFLGKYDLYYNLGAINFDLSNTNNIITLYDIAYIDRPDDIEAKNLSYFNNFASKAITSASKIVTSSDFSRARIIDHFKLNPEKVIKIPLGVDTDLYKSTFDKDLISKIAKKYKLSKFFLFVSTIEPRKNILGLLEAYELLPKSIKDEYELILIGGSSWKSQDIWNKIYKMQQSGLGVRYLGYTDKADLSIIYNLATTFVYPSWYEGFGLPILEAQASYTCVVTSNSGCCLETAKDSAILVDSNSPKSIAEGIMLSTKNDINQKYKDLGLINIQRFSWEKSGEQLLGLIQEFD